MSQSAALPRVAGDPGSCEARRSPADARLYLGAVTPEEAAALPVAHVAGDSGMELSVTEEGSVLVVGDLDLGSCPVSVLASGRGRVEVGGVVIGSGQGSLEVCASGQERAAVRDVSFVPDGSRRGRSSSLEVSGSDVVDASVGLDVSVSDGSRAVECGFNPDMGPVTDGVCLLRHGSVMLRSEVSMPPVRGNSGGSVVLDGAEVGDSLLDLGSRASLWAGPGASLSEARVRLGWRSSLSMRGVRARGLLCVPDDGELDLVPLRGQDGTLRFDEARLLPSGLLAIPLRYGDDLEAVAVCGIHGEEGGQLSLWSLDKGSGRWNRDLGLLRAGEDQVRDWEAGLGRSMAELDEEMAW